MPNSSARVPSLPDTPVGRQLSWYLSMLLSEGEGSSLADLARYVPRPELRLESITSDEDVRNNWRGNANRIGPIESITLESITDSEATVRLDCAKER